ncbi:hypothetical protein GCM10027169_37280 [Gordonia jinhuaensis]|uniref:Uncharacterized protein n=1 Tax=Gordonia jinhuaensis TaxID=1517702 RepID=A0A916T2S1_9ACTN|nr:hypothetical protein [Gordonia jinhuaensis]GGB26365.1 hypothetical protein GCM10011489_13150 [Gordonia jinhuaensis]
MTDKKSTMSKTVGVARAIAENEPDEDALALLAASADSSRELAIGQTSTNDLDMQFAEAMAKMFLDVSRDGPHTGLWRSVAKQVLALGMLTGEEIRTALLRGEIHDSTRWADLGDGTYPDRILGTASPVAGPDALDEPEPWDAEVDPAPASSRPLTGQEAMPQADLPPTRQEPAGDDEDAEPTAPVEIERTTSSQKTFRMPAGSYYSPGVNPLARPITGRRRPVTEIRTDVPGLGDQ